MYHQHHQVNFSVIFVPFYSNPRVIFRPFTVSHFQTSSQVNVWFEQEGRTADFNVCDRGDYIANMASSYGGMVFSASLWGGNGIDMGWLDGMTGCWGECNIQSNSVTFSNFNLW